MTIKTTLSLTSLTMPIKRTKRNYFQLNWKTNYKLAYSEIRKNHWFAVHYIVDTGSPVSYLS